MSRLGLFGAALLLTSTSVLLMGATPSSIGNLPARNFKITIVGFENEHEFSSTYLVSHGKPTAEEVSKVHEQPSSKFEFSIPLLREKQAREMERREASKKINIKAMPNAKWVWSSPDGKNSLVGFEDPFYDPMKTVVVVDNKSLQSKKTFSYSARKYILDVEWSQDSKVAAVLFTRERFSFGSILDILRFVSGHGVTLNTIGLDSYDLDSGASFEIVIAEDVIYGTGIFNSQNRAQKK